MTCEPVCYKCIECESMFLSVDDTLRHQLTVHFQRQTCNLCGQTFNSIGELRYHLIFNHDVLIVGVCAQCGMVFGTEESLLQHMHLHNLVTVRNQQRFIEEFGRNGREPAGFVQQRQEFQQSDSSDEDHGDMEAPDEQDDFLNDPVQNRSTH